ncbi:MAG: hypothetical protein AAFP26_11535, partial [Planctomycetota bacterium]
MTMNTAVPDVVGKSEATTEARPPADEGAGDITSVMSFLNVAAPTASCRVAICRRMLNVHLDARGLDRMNERGVRELTELLAIDDDDDDFELRRAVVDVMLKLAREHTMHLAAALTHTALPVLHRRVIAPYASRRDPQHGGTALASAFDGAVALLRRLAEFSIATGGSGTIQRLRALMNPDMVSSLVALVETAKEDEDRMTRAALRDCVGALAALTANLREALRVSQQRQCFMSARRGSHVRRRKPPPPSTAPPVQPTARELASMWTLTLKRNSGVGTTVTAAGGTLRPIQEACDLLKDQRMMQVCCGLIDSATTDHEVARSAVAIMTSLTDGDESWSGAARVVMAKRARVVLLASLLEDCCGCDDERLIGDVANLVTQLARAVVTHTIIATVALPTLVDALLLGERCARTPAALLALLAAVEQLVRYGDRFARAFADRCGVHVVKFLSTRNSRADDEEVRRAAARILALMWQRHPDVLSKYGYSNPGYFVSPDEK